MPKNSLAGQRYGMLYVEGYAETRGGYAAWNCLCDCGKRKIILGCNISSGKSASCGCRSAEAIRSRSTTHGHSVARQQSRTYKSWCDMHHRCSNKKNGRYGGRGISVCERWSEFANFLADMGERPNGKTLDRINNDGNYEPSNCRWATASEQRKNQVARRLKIYEFAGQKRCLKEWCDEFGVNYSAALWRLNQGQTFDRAVVAHKAKAA